MDPPRSNPDEQLAPPRDLLAMALMAASAVFIFLLVPALLLIWISPRWTLAEKFVATVIPAALLVATRAIHDDTGDPARTMGMLAIASCIFMAFFLAARLAGRRKERR